MRTVPRFALLSFSLIVLGACDDRLAATAEDPGEIEFRCPWCCTGCTTNSPRVNDYAFPELNLTGLPNSDGVRLVGLLDPGNTFYDVAVDDNEDLRALNAFGTPVAGGAALVGWRLWLRAPGPIDLHVHITDHIRNIPSLSAGADAITGYALAYNDPVTDMWINVCPGSTDHDDVSVTLIKGETYDRELKLVNPNMTDWVTIACRDEAVYKMKRMNYGPNDNFDGSGNPASPAERQATIKMITADYCGDGNSHTQQGTPVHWRDGHGVDSYPYPQLTPPTLEAHWDENGALCLTQPRLDDVDLDALGCELPQCLVFPIGTTGWFTWAPNP